MTSSEATANVLEEQLPAVVAANQEGHLNVENIDVFCEKGVFNVEETKSILEAGKRQGLRINFHGDELSCLGGAEVSIDKYYVLSYYAF